MTTTQQHHTDTTVTITGHTRPTSIEDLPDYQRQGHHIATVADSAHFIAYPALGHALLSAVEAAHAAGLTVTADGRIEVALTDEEIAKLIEGAQRSWDLNRDGYLQASAGKPLTHDSQYRRSAINSWAAAEGLNSIEWADA